MKITPPPSKLSYECPVGSGTVEPAVLLLQDGIHTSAHLDRCILGEILHGPGLPDNFCALFVLELTGGRRFTYLPRRVVQRGSTKRDGVDSGSRWAIIPQCA